MFNSMNDEGDFAGFTGTAGKITKALTFATTVYTTYQQLDNLYKRFDEWRESRVEPPTNFSITFLEEDLIFDYLMMWLSKDQKENNSLFAEYYDFSVRYRADLDSVDVFYIGDHRIRVGKEDDKKNDNNDQAGSLGSIVVSSYNPDKRITLHAENLDGLNALKDFLETLPSKFVNKEKIEYLHTPSKNGGTFNYNGRLVKRPLDTVFLAEGVLEDLIFDLDLFFEQQQQYVNFGIPYHRGYLLHGPPGTGKTSVVKGLSSHYNMNVYTASLNDVESDREFASLVGEIKERSIFLLEDIDAFRVAQERSETKKKGNKSHHEGLSVSGLLNALDGIQTLHNCIIVMTSNHPDHLDAALMRPGRIDRKIEIGYVDNYQLHNMITAFTGEDHTFEVNAEVVPAQIIEIFKRHMRSPGDAIPEIKELVS